MNAIEFIAEMEYAGFNLRVDGETLFVIPRPDPVLAERIRQYKPELMAIMAGPTPRLLTDDEKIAVIQTFTNFRNQHGHALVAAGWDRESVFLGLHPPDAITVGDVHGTIWLLMDGGRVERITEKAIYFRRARGEREAWLRSGCFVGDPYLQQLESTTLT